MTTAYDDIFSAALSLPPGSRAMLAEHLLKSLDADYQKEIDALWEIEAEKRVAEVEQGKVEIVSRQQVFQKLRSRGK
ncbi:MULTISPECIES: addiction module protein [unclassified Okeania]|uniref:addiction module protein n=1 Tax=unclassified Okeania TaxID=2634635 RepID=UPI0013BA12B0|nr:MULTISPECIES: addiction module protein [unclassified Okeania]NET13548.1 addiction module protein [Okeania sp. SIO1H6]NES77385.1 addiction module protein [Okeania sp. SIO1H4]NET20998.1 addiction module protein [Okeania sp. SIO1H5]NET77175.1 addiction module protein [Okeania sp. SIO1F9]NET94224.1 addiction module protein [Okeania sp. SIO1H2]